MKMRDFIAQFKDKTIPTYDAPPPYRARKFDDVTIYPLAEYREDQYDRRKITTVEEHIEDTDRYIAAVNEKTKLALGEAAITMARISLKAMQEKPWHFVETGVMSGAISLRPSTKMEGPNDHITVWSAKHEADTPLFLEAVRAHNKVINAERRKKNRELQPF